MWTMRKSLSVMLVFVIYDLLNICKGIIMSTSPMTAHCQYMYKRFVLSIQLYCSTAYKILLTNQYWCCMPRKMSLNMYTAVHGQPFWCVYHNTASRFVIKQAGKLNGFTSQQYQQTAPLRWISSQFQWDHHDLNLSCDCIKL